MQDIVDVRFSKSELITLVKTKGTCVTQEKKTRVVFLLPSQLLDIKCGIKENLDSQLLKYDYETKAIIIGYEKIKILSKYGSICYGYSRIALRIEANFFLFKPTIGSVLQGVVCKQSGRHLGCLVHKAFNVSIPLDDEDACGWDFAIGQDIKFTVVKLDLTTGPLPYILGRLNLADCRRTERDDAIGAQEVTSILNISNSAAVRVEGDGEVEGGNEHAAEVPRSQEDGNGTRWQGGTWEPESSVDPGGGVDGGRDTLISQLLKTVEMSIGGSGGQKKGGGKEKQAKKVSMGGVEGPLGTLSPSKKGPLGALSPSKKLGALSPSKKGLHSPNLKAKRHSKGGKESEPLEGDDSGSIIDRLLAKSKSLLGVSEVTPRGKKRKLADGATTGSPAKMAVVVKREAGEHQPVEEPSVWSHESVVPSDKSESSKPNRLSLPALREAAQSNMPVKVKRKSLIIKSENIKD